MFRRILAAPWPLILAISFSPISAIAENSVHPVWHDNDDNRDVYTQELLLALAASGSIKLVGTSSSTPVTPFNPYVTAQQANEFQAGMVEIQSTAGQTWPLDLSAVTRENLIGHLAVPPSGRIEDTVPLNSPVGNAIAAAANLHGTPEIPLVVACGGPLTCVADAYLIDPTIADKLVVTWLGGTQAGFTEYNSAVDGWGNAVAAKFLRITMFPIDIPSMEESAPRAPKVDIAASLPASPLRDLMFAKVHPGNPLPGDIDADGPTAVFIINPAIVKNSVRKKVTGTTTINFGGVTHTIPVLSNDPNGNVTVVTSVDQPLATRVWWRAFERAFGKLEADPFRYYPLADTQADAQIAFGTHELSITYRGPLLTLRRTSDGAEATFFEGARQGALDTVRGGGGVELTRWIPDNDEVRVMTWYDQSGSGHHATAASHLTAPRIVEGGRLNRGSRNEPVLRFSVDDFLQVNDGQVLSDIAQLSVSVWGLVEPWSTATQGFLSKQALSAPTGFQTGWGISVASPDQYLLTIGGQSSSQEARSVTGSAARNTWHHTSTVFNGSASGNTNRLKLKLDSLPMNLTFGGTIPDRIAAADSPLFLGRGGANLHLDGQIGEVIAWTLPLTNAQTSQLHARRFVSDFSMLGDVVPFQEWSALALLEGEAGYESAVAHGDGVSNLLKYAFNLNGGGPDSKTLTPAAGDLSGLPGVFVDNQPDGRVVLRLEYLRRKNSGLEYVPQISRDAGAWSHFDHEPVITPINDQWERAEIVSSAETLGESRRFVRLKVRLP